MNAPPRGEVWLVSRARRQGAPGARVGIPAGDSDRALVTLVPHTTALRGSRFEASLSVRFLRPVANQWGWRVGRVVDPFGHHWEIGKPLHRTEAPCDRA